MRVPVEEGLEPTREPCKLYQDVYPDAVPAAVIIESAIEEATALPEVQFNEGAARAIAQVLEGMLASRPTSFSETQFCLQNAFMFAD